MRLRRALERSLPGWRKRREEGDARQGGGSLFCRPVVTLLFVLEKIPPETIFLQRTTGGVIGRLGGFISRSNEVTGSRLYTLTVQGCCAGLKFIVHNFVPLGK